MKLSFSVHYVAGARITLSPVDTDSTSTRFAYSIALPYVAGTNHPIDSGRVEAGDLLRVPTQSNIGATHDKAYAALLAFLSAAGEHYEYTRFGSADDYEPGNFGHDVEAWSALNSDALSEELYETEGE